jgi:hypothetical protein
MEIQPTELHERVPFLRQLQYGRKSRRVYVQSETKNTSNKKSPKNLGLFLFRIILCRFKNDKIYRCFAISETKSSISVLLSTNKRASTTTTSTFCRVKPILDKAFST